MGRVQLDAGNSHLKWRLLDADGLDCQQGRLDYALADLKNRLVEWSAFAEVVEIASVAAAHQEGLIRQALDAVGGFRPVWAETRPAQGGLINAYRDHRQMGVDRWLALLAAWHEVGEALAVVDAGSAITVDFVDSRGHHRGGYILPGRRLMLEALWGGTGRVRFEAVGTTDSAPGTDTASCVEHGLNWATEALAAKLESDLHQRGIQHLFLTGGDAGHWRRVLEPGPRYRPDLVLDGLSVYVALEAGELKG